MGFLDSILGRNKPSAMVYDKLDEVPCNDGYSVLINGMDSTMGINGEDCYVRRYPIALKLPEGMSAKDFCDKTGGDLKSIMPDGNIGLMIVPGEMYIASNWLGNLAEHLNNHGVTLPVTEIMNVMSADMHEHGEGYLQPVAQKTAAQSK